MTHNDRIEVVDRTVNTRPRSILVAVGSQGFADLERERARKRRARVLRAVLWGFAIGVAIGVLSAVRW